MSDAAENGNTLKKSSQRDEQKRLTYERLLDCAIEAFEEVGYRASTVAQIARRAGTDRTTFYLHFRNKVDLATAIAQRHTSAVAKIFHSLGNLEQPQEKDVRTWVKRNFDYWTEYMTDLEVLCEAIVTDRDLSARTTEYNAKIVDILLRNKNAALSAREKRLRQKKAELLVETQRLAMFSLLCRKEAQASLNDTIAALADLWWESVFAPNRHDASN